MKITTEKALEYYEAFNRIDGYPRAVEQGGRVNVVMESYDLSPKVKWRCVMNKTLLRPIKEAAEAARKQKQDKMNDILRGIPTTTPKEEADKIIRDAENGLNKELAEITSEEHDIPGLVKLPGVGVRIRGRDPGIIAILTSIWPVFGEGEPDYGQDKPAKDD